MTDGPHGRVIVQKRYTRAEIRGNPGRLYVFGDNVARLGRGGQARECRGEPNVVGIVTKWQPATDPAAYFHDHDLDRVRWSIQQDFRTLADHLRSGGDVVWPADGVGTGLARLSSTAPAIADFIERCRKHLASIAAA
jgi:hypothetical protein